ncbi:MAG: divergent polysaccharide deacetylase family protein [Planktomarina sp.]
MVGGTVFKGFIFGAIWGTLFGALVLILVSLIAEVPGQKSPNATIETALIRSVPIPVDPNLGPVTQGDTATQTVQPERTATDSTVSAALPAEVTSPGLQPAPVVETDPLGGASDGTAVLGDVVEGDEPVFQTPQAAAPEQPTIEVIETAPLPNTQAAEAAIDIARATILNDIILAPAPEPGLTDAGDTLDGLPATAQDVILNRLPTVTGTSGDAAADLPPVKQFAVVTDVDPEKPLMSVVLLDDPRRVLGPSILASVSVPVTIAVDAAAPDALERSKAYRDAGVEIVLSATLPTRASASDIESAFGFYFSAVPEAVAVFDATGNGFRGDRQIAEAVNNILADSGHGLLTLDQGLNSTGQSALSAGIPVATINRDLDREGQNATVIRRFLSQAAFNARQQNEISVLARLRPDTVTALQIWAQQERAKSLNLVPISVILNR